MFANFSNSTLYRVQSILFTVFGVAACQSLFFLLLPLQLKSNDFSTSSIGVAMSFYALGAIFAGLFGARVIAHVGHIRSFTLMSSVMVIVSVLHGFYSDIWLTGLLRAIAGFALISNFITMESWLNVITDNSNRGRIFSIYQIVVGIGGMSAPFVLSSFELSDPRMLGVVGIFLAVSIIVMSITKLPVPTISQDTNPMSLKSLWGYSPSGTVSCFCAGLIASVSTTLISLYAVERVATGVELSLILSSAIIGGLLTQYPTGWFADRCDKRSVAASLMGIGLVSNGMIILDAYWQLPVPVLIFAFLVSGGTAAALFPLAVTQIFDHIEGKDAVRATGTLQIILWAGGFLGPIIAGTVMEWFGTLSLFFYIGMVHIIVMVFLLVRRLYIRQERLEPTFPYQVTTEPVAMCRTGLDPRLEYNLADVGDPELKLLLRALEQHPPRPGILIKTALDSARLGPVDIAVHLVLALPKHSDELIGELVSLYPEMRMEIARSLHELILLRKKHINQLVIRGLGVGASEEEKQKIDAMIQEALAEVPQSSD